MVSPDISDEERFKRLKALYKRDLIRLLETGWLTKTTNLLGNLAGLFLDESKKDSIRSNLDDQKATLERSRRIKKCVILGLGPLLSSQNSRMQLAFALHCCKLLGIFPQRKI